MSVLCEKTLLMTANVLGEIMLGVNNQLGRQGSDEVTDWKELDITGHEEKWRRGARLLLRLKELLATWDKLRYIMTWHSLSDFVLIWAASEIIK